MSVEIILTELARLEEREDLIRLGQSAPLAPIVSILLNLSNPPSQLLALIRGADASPDATSLLVREIQKDADHLIALAPILLRAIPCVETNIGVTMEIDNSLYKIHSKLTPQMRQWAEQRPDVRRALGLSKLAKEERVKIPRDTWPPAGSIEGVQIRLNAQDYPAGPITGEWNNKTENALTKFQFDMFLEPTGTLNKETIEELEALIP